MRWLTSLGRIAYYFWALILAALVPAIVVALGMFVLSACCGPQVFSWLNMFDKLSHRPFASFTFLGFGILLIGVWQLLAAVYTRPRECRRPQTWARMYRYPIRPTNSRHGATLTSTVVAMFIIALCLTMALQGYIQGSRGRLVQAQRTVALATCQERIETLRARGYTALPAIGERSFSVHADEALHGKVRVEQGPITNSKEVTVTIRWPQEQRLPAGGVSLSTIISARGVGG